MWKLSWNEYENLQSKFSIIILFDEGKYFDRLKTTWYDLTYPQPPFVCIDIIIETKKHLFLPHKIIIITFSLLYILYDVIHYIIHF